MGSDPATCNVRVQHCDGVRLVPVDEVIYFKAEDKYKVVITGGGCP